VFCAAARPRGLRRWIDAEPANTHLLDDVVKHREAMHADSGFGVAPRQKWAPFAVRLSLMNKCRYCDKIRDEWDCHGPECRAAIAKALRRQRQGLPMVPKVIRNEIPAGASAGEVIARLSHQRLRARRGNEERRERKEIDQPDAD
jgi:hypothetical protein